MYSAFRKYSPPWNFPYFVVLQPRIKTDFWGVCIILFTQNAYHFDDAKYFLLLNKQEKKHELERA